MAGDDGVPPPPPSKIEIHNPFYLGAHDRPGDFITPIRLKLDNFDSWSHAVKVALSSRRKFGFLDGTIVDAVSPATKEDWIVVHCMLVSWLMNTIDPEVKSMLSNYDNAKRLWDDLHERFCVVNGPRIHQLKSQINKCEQTKTMSVAIYYGKLKVLWDDLANLQPLINCNCGKCSCNVGKQHEKRREDDMLQQFLLGLYSEYYAQIRSNILAQDPLPSLNKAYQQVSQEEFVRGLARVQDDPSSAVGFAVRATTGQGRGSNDKHVTNKPVCSHCKKPGHLVADCYALQVCTHCKKRGHNVSRCYELNGYPEGYTPGDRGNKPTTTSHGRGVARANATAGSSPSPPLPPSNSSKSTTPSSSHGQVFSDEQWKAIVGFFGNSNIPENRLSGKFDNTSWIIDTGATHHVTGEKSWLFDIKQLHCPVGLPNGDTVIASMEGSVYLSDTITLNHVLYVPNLSCNLLSVSQLNDNLQSIVTFNSDMCLIQDQMKALIGTGVRRDGLYYFSKPEVVSAVEATSDVELWHRRMGHPSEKVVKLLPPVSRSKTSLNKGCEVCFRAKHHRDRFPLSNNNCSRIFEKVHCDLWGPYRHESSCGARYFLTIVDDFSRAVWIYLMVNKTEVFSMFMTFVAMVDRQFGQSIKIVQSDNGTEFKCLFNFFRDTGVIFQSSCVGTPQQNGRVERKHKHILSVGRALRFQANLPIYFWGECVLAAAHLINRTPTPILQNRTPFEILFNKLPNFDVIRTFGCLCFAHNQKTKGDKFASKSRKCVFVGYPFGQKGWRVYDLDAKEFFVSRDVKFIEDVFPFSSPDDVNIESNADYVGEIHEDFADLGVCDEDCGVEMHSCDQGGEGTSRNHGNHRNQPAASAQQPQPTQTVTQPDAGSNEQQLEDLQQSTENMGRGFRTKYPSVKLRDHVTHTVFASSPSLPASVSDHPSGTPYPLTHYIHCDNFSVSYRKFVAAVVSNNDPKSFKEAMRYEGWRQSMKEEIRALENNGTWTLELLPPGKKALGSQWVYRTKFLSNGEIERLKSRLVVLGNHQQAGIDYTETFAPVAKMTTVRIFLAIAASKNWELHQMDVHNAFLHGDLDEEVYMKLPPGFECSDPNMVCRLRKSLYGLKQAPRCWFAKLVTALKEYGFLQSYSDYSLFTYTKTGIQINVLVYVDDIVISGNDSAALCTFKSYLSDCFKMKDLGPLKYFLGIEVARSSAGLFLYQRKYTLDIISEAGLLGAKPSGFPIEQNHKLGLASGDLLEDPESYRRLVGRLIYLAVTRPDLAYSVHILSQFMQEPRTEHWEAALRVVRYLKGTPGQGILLSADCDLTLQGWCDSDWAACPLTRRSLTGWLVFLGKSPVSWKTKKQHTVSRSSAEAEYRSMATITCELKWLKGLLLSLGVHHPKAIKLFCDSQSALHIAKNPVFHERTKHIEVDCHFVRDAINEGLISPSHVPTSSQLADIFTKALGKMQFDNLLSKLGIHDPHAPT